MCDDDLRLVNGCGTSVRARAWSVQSVRWMFMETDLGSRLARDYLGLRRIGRCVITAGGRVAERLKAPVPKTGRLTMSREFESHPFRHRLIGEPI